MPQQHINDIELYYELTGDGDDTIVLVHGGWTDHLSWQFVVPALAERHRVLSYDRRGHSRSVGSARAQASRRQHEEDLAALIETLDLGVVNLVGNSYGGSISLGLASRRPDLVRCVIAHEPPLLDVAQLHQPLEAELSDVHAIVAEVRGCSRPAIRRVEPGCSSNRSSARAHGRCSPTTTGEPSSPTPQPSST